MNVVNEAGATTFVQMARQAAGRRTAPAMIYKIAAVMRSGYIAGLESAWNTRTEVAMGFTLQEARSMVLAADAPLTLIARRAARCST